MRVAGFSDGLESAVLVRVDRDLVIPVVSMPVLIVLKLLAWQDRKHEKRDAADIFTILNEYGDAGNEDRLYGEALDVLESAGYDLETCGRTATRSRCSQYNFARIGNPRPGHLGIRIPDRRAHQSNDRVIDTQRRRARSQVRIARRQIPRRFPESNVGGDRRDQQHNGNHHDQSQRARQPQP